MPVVARAIWFIGEHHQAPSHAMESQIGQASQMLMLTLWLPWKVKRQMRGAGEIG